MPHSSQETTTMIPTLRALGGVMTGSGLLFSYRSMASANQGQTDFIAYKQSNILYEVAASSLSLLKELGSFEVGKSKRKWITSAIAYPLPFALQILNHKIDGKSHPVLKQGILYARRHVEHVAFAVDLCVSVLFTYYVAPYYGAGILVGLTIELLNEQKVMPAKIRAVWEKTWIAISFSRLLNVALLDGADLWDVGRFIAEISIFTWETYFERGAPQEVHKHALTHSNVEELLAKPLDQLQVNASHLSIKPQIALRGSSGIDIQKTMLELVKRVSWTKKTSRTFKQMLLRNTIFKGNYPHKVKQSDISDRLARQEFQQGAMLLATQIANSAIETGDGYIRYEILQSMLKSILKSLLECPDIDADLTALDDLFQLALEGGDYCGGGKAETIENIYNRRVLQGAKIPLKLKFLYLLTSMRKRWFDAAYARISQVAYKLPQGIFDPSDIHFSNISIFYFDKCLKLHSEALKNDINIMESGLCSRLNRLLFSTLLDYTFWPYAMRSQKWYSAKALVNDIASAPSFSGFSGSEIATWWQGWLDRPSRDTRRKK